jgi:hypothetical protein
VVRRQPRLTLVAVHSDQDASHAGVTHLLVIVIFVVSLDRGLFRVLLAPLFATLDALLSVVDGNIGWCLLATTQGHLPASLGWPKHDRLIVGGMWGGDTVRLPEYVPEKVTMLILEWALCIVLMQHAHVPLANLTVGLGSDVPALPPQWGSGREVSRW